MLQRGYIYWAHLDKRRPVLVVSPNYRNDRAQDVIVVPCSTVRHLAPTHVPLRKREGGVPQASVLKCEQILTLHKGDVDPSALGAMLSSARMREVETGILRAIGIPAP